MYNWFIGVLFPLLSQERYKLINLGYDSRYVWFINVFKRWMSRCIYIISIDESGFRDVQFGLSNLAEQVLDLLVIFVLKVTLCIFLMLVTSRDLLLVKILLDFLKNQLASFLDIFLLLKACLQLELKIKKKKFQINFDVKSNTE